MFDFCLKCCDSSLIDRSNELDLDAVEANEDANFTVIRELDSIERDILHGRDQMLVQVAVLQSNLSISLGAVRRAASLLMSCHEALNVHIKVIRRPHDGQAVQAYVKHRGAPEAIVIENNATKWEDALRAEQAHPDTLWGPLWRLVVCRQTHTSDHHHQTPHTEYRRSVIGFFNRCVMDPHTAMHFWREFLDVLRRIEQSRKNVHSDFTADEVLDNVVQAEKLHTSLPRPLSETLPKPKNMLPLIPSGHMVSRISGLVHSFGTHNPLNSGFPLMRTHQGDGRVVNPSPTLILPIEFSTEITDRLVTVADRRAVCLSALCAGISVSAFSSWISEHRTMIEGNVTVTCLGDTLAVAAPKLLLVLNHPARKAGRSRGSAHSFASSEVKRRHAVTFPVVERAAQGLTTQQQKQSETLHETETGLSEGPTPSPTAKEDGIPSSSSFWQSAVSTFSRLITRASTEKVEVDKEGDGEQQQHKHRQQSGGSQGSGGESVRKGGEGDTTRKREASSDRRGRGGDAAAGGSPLGVLPHLHPVPSGEDSAVEEEDEQEEGEGIGHPFAFSPRERGSRGEMAPLKGNLCMSSRGRRGKPSAGYRGGVADEQRVAVRPADRDRDGGLGDEAFCPREEMRGGEGQGRAEGRDAEYDHLQGFGNSELHFPVAIAVTKEKSGKRALSAAATLEEFLRTHGIRRRTEGGSVRLDDEGRAKIDPHGLAQQWMLLGCAPPQREGGSLSGSSWQTATLHLREDPNFPSGAASQILQQEELAHSVFQICELGVWRDPPSICSFDSGPHDSSVSVNISQLWGASRGPGGMSTGNADLCHSLVTVGGRLCWSLSWNSRRFDRESMQQYAEKIKQEVRRTIQINDEEETTDMTEWAEFQHAAPPPLRSSFNPSPRANSGRATEEHEHEAVGVARTCTELTDPMFRRSDAEVDSQVSGA
uniref:Uncharacterized protein n=1 Tax=Chromera velia CCMP2878 TaxID=1169474 RepID=A0A0G4IDV3_9ALVE|eukprot:Cvel_13480.t1-p1 / transcript=Cvel_13480.t1 / gene=Cvel_13480 / organism=Chromera_velia_CCMP2878 / gene_product=hypothetical protein / transcript_product=hypothetical protein / location=Cvel_scaffold922:48860-53778(+) / protein_length=933 / sequence_SO=supercontig / SO=protein_coding / is_pseudo=false